jgi:GT2 family glycosyltransferase
MSEHNPRVGVVVLNFRGAEDTVCCLRSLRASSVPVEVLVVDNASGDGSVEHIEAGDPRLRVIVNDANLGFAAGNDIGIERLREEGAEFVWVLNNDTVVDPGALRAMLDVAATDERLGAVGSVIHDMADRQRVLTWGGGSVGRWTGFTRDARAAGDRVDYLTGASLLLRVAALDDVGSFDPRFFFTWEDVDLGLRLQRNGWRIAVADQARVWHRWGASASATSAFRMEHHAAGLVLFMRKHSVVPALTSLPMLGWYALTAVRRRDPGLFRAALRGWRSGWSK